MWLLYWTLASVAAGAVWALAYRLGEQKGRAQIPAVIRELLMTAAEDTSRARLTAELERESRGMAVTALVFEKDRHARTQKRLRRALGQEAPTPASVPRLDWPVARPATPDGRR